MGLSVSASSPHEEQEQKAQKAIGKKISRIDTGSILVLDDDFDINNIIKMSLQKQGFHVFGFTDPLLALEHFKANCDTCDLVISDWRMPTMNGLEFLQNITKIKPTTKILLMSAFNVKEDQEYSELSKEINISGFIQKPVSMRRFGQIIRSNIIEK
jgi:DNA-binding NtrC family response regulator